MEHKKIIALPMLFMAITNTAYANVVTNPTFTNLLSTAAPSGVDYTFDQRNISVSVSKVTTGTYAGDYQLKAIGSGNINFYGPNAGLNLAGTSASYTLTAYFNVIAATSNTPQHLGLDLSKNTNGNSFEIIGNLSATTNLPTGLSGTPTTAGTILLDSSLNSFGYSKAQGDIAFGTTFLPSWSNQTAFTGGSTGESVYLFDQGALQNGGYGRLTSLVNAFASGDLKNVVGQTYNSIQSVATVPLPSSIVLFSTSGLALMGLARKRSKS